MLRSTLWRALEMGWSTSPCFAGVLSRLRARLVALGAERRRRGRTRYWILKRDFTPGEVLEL